MLTRLERILKDRKGELTARWAEQLSTSSPSYRRRPPAELKQTTKHAYEADLAFMFKDDQKPLDEFIDFIVAKRFSARFKLSDVLYAFELFRVIARPVILREMPPEEALQALELLEKPVNYAVHNFAERFQTRHEEELLSVNRHLEEALKQLKVEKDNATRANTLKDHFMANVSHELRTPLTSIIGFSRLLMDKSCLDDQTNDKLNIIYNQGKSLLHIINTIMMISEINAGTARMREDLVNLNEIADQQAKAIQKHPLAKRHRITLSGKKNLPVFKGDSEKLTALIYELLLNAVKFSDKKTLISVQCGQQNGHLYLKVRDQGIGIEEKSIQSIFNPFFQLDGGITRRFGGSGLGLAMAKLVVNMHKGEIAVISKPGKGSEFSVTLPYKPPL